MDDLLRLTTSLPSLPNISNGAFSSFIYALVTYYDCCASQTCALILWKKEKARKFEHVSEQLLNLLRFGPRKSF